MWESLSGIRGNTNFAQSHDLLVLSEKSEKEVEP